MFCFAMLCYGMYVCMYVGTYVHTYVRTYVCMYVYIHVEAYGTYTYIDMIGSVLYTTWYVKMIVDINVALVESMLAWHGAGLISGGRNNPSCTLLGHWVWSPVTFNWYSEKIPGSPYYGESVHSWRASVGANVISRTSMNTYNVHLHTC